MPPLVKDYLEFQKIEYLNGITVANADACLKNYHTTDGLTELLSRILDTMVSKLASEEGAGQAGPISTLLTGGYGTGKSHLLAVIYSLLTSAKPVAPALGDPRIQSSIALLRKANPLTIWIDLANSPATLLPELILSRIAEEFEKRFQKQLLDPNIIPGIDILRAHEIITFHLTTEGPICLLIDGLSSRALNRTVPELNEDIEFLSFMGFSSKATPLFLLASAHEDFFSPTSPLGIDSVLMAQTLENFRIEWIDRISLREIVCRVNLRKNIRQKQDL